MMRLNMDCKLYSEDQLIQKLNSEFENVINDTLDVYNYLFGEQKYKKFEKLLKSKTEILDKIYYAVWKEYYVDLDV